MYNYVYNEEWDDYGTLSVKEINEWKSNSTCGGMPIEDYNIWLELSQPMKQFKSYYLNFKYNNEMRRIQQKEFIYYIYLTVISQQKTAAM